MTKLSQKENEKSTPAENKKPDVRHHVNQSTEKQVGGSSGWIAIFIIIALIVLGLLFFGPWAA